MKIFSLLFVLLFLACTNHHESATQTSAKELMALMVVQSPPKEEVEPSTEPQDEETETTPAFVDPYEGWESWCEPMFYDTRCKTDSDCSEFSVKAIGRPLRCGRPWWSEKDDLRDENGNPITVCLPGYAREKEREWRYDRLREIVRQQYFDETEHCKLDGRPIHKEHWRCQKEWKKAEVLTSFLWLVYKRETTARPWKRHRLNPDLSANVRAWVRRADDYGWNIELACSTVWKSGKRKPKHLCRSKNLVIKSMDPLEDKESNPYYAHENRWQYGLGGLGQNAALWTDTWDTMAPPEILCREVPAFETYLRRARRVVSMLQGGVDCDGDGKPEYRDPDPTWLVVHRGTAGGKVCPPKNAARAKEYEDNFRKRAKWAGLDPDETVSLSMLGKPIDKDTQNARVEEIYAILQAKHPSPMTKND